MMAWMMAAALAGSGALPHTASTVGEGMLVVRQPLGPSSFGLTDTVALELTPFDLRIGGPRLAVERGWTLSDTLDLSLSPSLAAKASGRRASAALTSTLTKDLGGSEVSLSVMADSRWLRRRELGPKTRSTLSIDRLEAPLVAVWDAPLRRGAVRVEARVPLRERGDSVHYMSASVSYLDALGPVGVRAGVGVLLGSPRDQYLLGRYHYTFVLPYPRLDLWWERPPRRLRS